MDSRAIKLIKYSSYAEEFPNDDLGKVILQDVCDHKTPLGESNIFNNCCILCGLKFYPISGKSIKAGIKAGIFPNYIKYRILKTINRNDAFYFKSKADITYKLKRHYNEIKNHKTYYIPISGIFKF